MGGKLTSMGAQEKEHCRKLEMTGHVKCFCKVMGDGAIGGFGVEVKSIGE